MEILEFLQNLKARALRTGDLLVLLRIPYATKTTSDHVRPAIEMELKQASSEWVAGTVPPVPLLGATADGFIDQFVSSVSAGLTKAGHPPYRLSGAERLALRNFIVWAIRTDLKGRAVDQSKVDEWVAVP